MKPSDKIVDVESLLPQLKKTRESGGRIAFTNGCFDLLHIGHVHYLEAARQEGDVLVVGLNADRSVRAIKGDKRPLNGQQERARVLAALACVDYVVIFEEPDPLLLIRALRPDVLVKGADWPEEGIVGGDDVKSRGGSVVRVPLVPGASTSELIRTIVRRYGAENDGR